MKKKWLLVALAIPLCSILGGLGITSLAQQQPPKSLTPIWMYILGSFGRPIRSTNDALNVYLTNPADGCAGAKINAAISQTTSSQVITGQPGQRVLICYAMIIGADAENLSIVEGTGAVCATGILAVMGGTTAATGPNFTAGSGYTGGGSNSTIHNTLIQGNNVCVLQSGSGRVAGNFEYVYTPF